jgi:hypothetical protein
MAINRSPYSVGDTITRNKKKYVVINVKQRPKVFIARRISSNNAGLEDKKYKFTWKKRK